MAHRRGAHGSLNLRDSKISACFGWGTGGEGPTQDFRLGLDTHIELLHTLSNAC